MGIGKGKTDYLLSLIREGKQMTLGQQLRLTAYLSVPAIMAQISSIAMQYIDASMVGSLGANAAASIGLVSTTTWLFWGVCAAAATGFSVQVAHRIGAGDFVEAKKILRQAVTATLVFSSLLAVGGICISGMLPLWLGGSPRVMASAASCFVFGSPDGVTSARRFSGAFGSCSPSLPFTMVCQASMRGRSARS